MGKTIARRKKSTPLSRIAPVDGLRAVAVLGVLWAHIWSWCHSPKLEIPLFGHYVLDVQRWFSTVGTGVDLFFVISGFCMGILALKDSTRSKLALYPQFMIKRFWRLAPAFFAAAVVYALSQANDVSHTSLLYSFLAHLFFLHAVVPVRELGVHFWSIGTEWQFYLCFPFLAALPRKQTRWVVLAVLAAVSLYHRQWLYAQTPYVQTYWAAQLPARVVEFAWGIVIAQFFHDRLKLPVLLRGAHGFILASLVVLMGRVVMTSEAFSLGGGYGNWVRAFGEPILTLGCGLMLWNVISSESFFSRILSSRPATQVGRWSYSIYLWHWIIAGICLDFLARFGMPDFAHQHTTFFMTLMFLLPISAFSFHWLERPFLKGNPFKTSKTKGPEQFWKWVAGASFGINLLLIAAITCHLVLRPRLNFVLTNVLKKFVSVKSDQSPALAPELCGKSGHLASATAQHTVFVGDSIVAEADLPRLFPELLTLNHGVTSDWTDCVLYRLGRSISPAPRALALMVGVNDLNEGRTPEAIASNIGRILATAKAQAPNTRLFLISMLPTDNERSRQHIDSLTIAKTNLLLRGLAPRFGAKYIDSFAVLAGPDRRITAENSKDGLHLAPAGYDAWAKALRPYLTQK